MACSFEPGCAHHDRSRSRMARSRGLSGIATSFPIQALDYKHPPTYRPAVGAAAEAAEAIRASRAAILDALRSGELRLEELESDAAAQVKVVVLAESVPGVGKVHARRRLAELGLEDSDRWGELAPAVRRRLVSALTSAG